MKSNLQVMSFPSRSRTQFLNSSIKDQKRPPAPHDLIDFIPDEETNRVHDSIEAGGDKSDETNRLEVIDMRQKKGAQTTMHYTVRILMQFGGVVCPIIQKFAIRRENEKGLIAWQTDGHKVWEDRRSKWEMTVYNEWIEREDGPISEKGEHVSLINPSKIMLTEFLDRHCGEDLLQILPLRIENEGVSSEEEKMALSKAKEKQQLEQTVQTPSSSLPSEIETDIGQNPGEQELTIEHQVPDLPNRSQSLWWRFKNTLKKLARPSVPTGHRRLEWICVS